MHTKLARVQRANSEIRARKVRRDSLHLHSLRHLSLTLAAYVGEDVTIRFDLRDGITFSLPVKPT
jgi:hypothetical protein